MFLTSVTLMANPSSPRGGDSFFTTPSVIGLSGGTHHHLQMALTLDWQKQPTSS